MGAEEMSGLASQRERMPTREIIRASTTRNRYTGITRGSVAKPPSRRGGRAGGRGRGGSSSAGISRLSALSSSAALFSSSSTSTSLSRDVHQEQVEHSSTSIQVQHHHPPSLLLLQQHRHPLDLSNAELAAQDMLLGLGTATGSGDVFDLPTPDTETYSGLSER